MKTYQVLLAGILSIGLLASCASDEKNEPSPSKGTTKTLTISLNGAGTRVSDITSDPGLATPNPESAINNAVIAITDGTTGNIKSMQKATMGTSGGNTTASVSVSSINTSTDSVLVAVNVPSNFLYSGITKNTDFHKLTAGIDNALSSTSTFGTLGNAETGYYLPMYGSGTITSSGSNYAANVNVYHLVAKITLSSLKEAFDASGAFSGATFTPTEVFMFNVPEKLCYDYDTTPWLVTPTAWYQGESSKNGDGDYYKEYLGTGVFSPALSALSTSAETFATGSTSLFFYTIPNNGSISKDTRLIIKGTFKANVSATGVPVYYPISINHGGTGTTGATITNGGADKCVYPNRNYNLTVVIKGRGNDNVNDPVDPQSLAATLTVQPFTAVTQTNTFN